MQNKKKLMIGLLVLSTILGNISDSSNKPKSNDILDYSHTFEYETGNGLIVKLNTNIEDTYTINKLNLNIEYKFHNLVQTIDIDTDIQSSSTKLLYNLKYGDSTTKDPLDASLDVALDAETVSDSTATGRLSYNITDDLKVSTDLGLDSELLTISYSF